MRLVLALLLLLQLDPVIGAALCLEREQAASRECLMPVSSAPAERTLAPAGVQVGGCSFAQLCAQPAPAVTQMNEALQLQPFPSSEQLLLVEASAPRGALAPPFHPPRV